MVTFSLSRRFSGHNRWRSITYGNIWTTRIYCKWGKHVHRLCELSPLFNIQLYMSAILFVFTEVKMSDFWTLYFNLLIYENICLKSIHYFNNFHKYLVELSFIYHLWIKFLPLSSNITLPLYLFNMYIYGLFLTIIISLLLVYFVYLLYYLFYFAESPCLLL